MTGSDRWPRRIKTVIQRQQRMPPEHDDDRLLVQRQHRGFRILWPGRKIGNRRSLAPLGHGLLVRRENAPLGAVEEVLGV